MAIAAQQKFSDAERAKHLRGLRTVLDQYPSTSRSQLIRNELSETIIAYYDAGLLDRTQFHAALAEMV